MTEGRRHWGVRRVLVLLLAAGLLGVSAATTAERCSGPQRTPVIAGRYHLVFSDEYLEEFNRSRPPHYPPATESDRARWQEHPRYMDLRADGTFTRAIDFSDFGDRIDRQLHQILAESGRWSVRGDSLVLEFGAKGEPGYEKLGVRLQNGTIQFRPHETWVRVGPPGEE